MRALFISLLCALLLSGCLTPRMTGQVQSFAKADALTPEARVYVTSGTALLDSSLEFQNYRALLQDHLIAQGFQVTETRAEADLIATLSYGIDGGTPHTEVIDTPRQFYPYGFYSVGPHGRYRSFGATFLYPYPAAHRYQRTTITKDIYTRDVALTLTTAQKGEPTSPAPVYEGKIVSKGTCPLLGQVMPEMLQGLFLNFPDTSGPVEIESQHTCDTNPAK